MSALTGSEIEPFAEQNMGGLYIEDIYIYMCVCRGYNCLFGFWFQGLGKELCNFCNLLSLCTPYTAMKHGFSQVPKPALVLGSGVQRLPK